MRRILNIPIPYEHIKGNASLSKVSEMNEFQKIISVLILKSDKLGISTSMLWKVIEDKLGIIKVNQEAIRDDVRELLDMNCNSKILNPFKTKIGVIRLKFNKNILEDIENNLIFKLLTTRKRDVVSELFLPVFKKFEIIKGKVKSIDVKGEYGKFKREINYNDDQIKDILSQEFNALSSKDEVIKETKTTLSGKIIWQNVEVEYKYENKKIIALNNESETIFSLISSGKINLKLETQVNKTVDQYDLPLQNDGKSVPLDFIKNKKIISLKSINKKIIINNDSINLMGYIESDAMLLNSAIKIRNITVIENNFMNFVSNYIHGITEEFIKELSSENMEKLYFYIFENNIKPSLIEEKFINQLLTMEIYRKLSNKQLKSLLSNPSIKSYLISQFSKNFNDDDLIKYKLVTNTSEKDMIRLFNIIYKNKRIFTDWKDEETFYEIWEKMMNLKSGEMSTDELESLNKKLIKKLPMIFKDQPILKKAINHYNKILKLSLNMTQEKINSEFLMLRKIIEKKLEKTKNVSIRDAAEKILPKKDSQKIIEAYGIISNDFMHNSNVIKSINEQEEILKQLINEVNKILNNIKHTKGDK